MTKHKKEVYKMDEKEKEEKSIDFLNRIFNDSPLLEFISKLANPETFKNSDKKALSETFETLIKPYSPMIEKYGYGAELKGKSFADSLKYAGGEFAKLKSEIVKNKAEIESIVPESENYHTLAYLMDGIEKFNTLLEELRKELEEQNRPKILSQKTDSVDYPIDKPNSHIWNMLSGAKNNGQVQLAIDTSGKDTKTPALIYYGINFDKLEPGMKITKQLTPYDKRVYIAAGALWNGGNEIITASQIYKMMGNSGRPSAAQIQKINDSLTKMGSAHVYLDNTNEIKVNNGYKKFKYDASLLPFERISAYVDDQLTDSAIHLFREPPLLYFARERKQITTFKRQLLESPISKTDANLRLEDYLLERISHMKNPNNVISHKILYETIYKHCEIKSKMQKQRAPEKIEAYLEHYKKCQWIKDYKQEADGVTIIL